MSDKQTNIVNMFNQIAKTYDKANRILSFGVDTIWRKKACNKSFEFYNQAHIEQIVDVACGTGDMMDYWKRQAKANIVVIDKMLGVDPSEGMIGVAKEKFPDFAFQIGYATQIDMPNQSTDILSISYGIRNVIKRQEALFEFNRILKENGLVVILEFTKRVKPSVSSVLTNFYLNKVLPKVGGFISRNKEAYEYLPNSIENFLTVDSMQNELKEAGFEILFTKSFSMNISTLFIARKIKSF